VTNTQTDRTNRRPDTIATRCLPQNYFKFLRGGCNHFCAICTYDVLI